MAVDISYKRIAVITTPVVLTQLSYTLMGVIDTVMVGRLGVTPLAAVGLANLVTWWFFSFFWGLLSGVNTLVAQAIGARDNRAAGVAFWQGLYIAVGAAVCIAGVWPLVPLLFRLTQATPEVQTVAVEYMRIRLLGGLGFTLLLTCDNFYRGLGRTLTPMWCGAFQCTVNCCLNYVLIFGKFGVPAMGTAGAAWGTTIALFLTGAVIFGTIAAGPNVRSLYSIWQTWRWHPRVARTLMRLSLPVGTQVFWEMGGITVFAAVIARLGNAQMAATNAVIQAWSVSFMGAFALSVGATTLVGQCVGAQEAEQARRVTRRVLHVGYVLMGLMGIVYLSIPEHLMSLFVRAAEFDMVQPYARPLFIVVAICLVFDLQFNVASGALRGAGDTTYPMLVNIGSAWLVLVPATLWAAPRYGVVGAWACLILHVVVMAGLLLLRIRGDRWVRAPQARAGGPDGPLVVVPPVVAEEHANARVLAG